jgi:hypothetical protein
LTIVSNHCFNMLLMRLICLQPLASLTLLFHTILLPPFLAWTVVPNITVLTASHIPMYCLHSGMNVNGRNFFCSQELNNGMLFEPLFLMAFHSTGTEPELWIAVDTRVRMVGGGIMWLRGAVFMQFSLLWYIMWQRRQGFQPILIYICEKQK